MKLPDVTDPNVGAFVEMIDARLVINAQERQALEFLRRLYAGDGAGAATTLPSTAPANGKLPAISGTANVVMPMLTGGAQPKSDMGLTEAVLHTVAELPGLKSRELIDRVVAIAVTESKDPRRAVSYTAGYLVEQDRLIKRNGRFYPIPKGNAGQKREALTGENN